MTVKLSFTVLCKVQSLSGPSLFWFGWENLIAADETRQQTNDFIEETRIRQRNCQTSEPTGGPLKASVWSGEGERQFREGHEFTRANISWEEIGFSRWGSLCLEWLAAEAAFLIELHTGTTEKPALSPSKGRALPVRARSEAWTEKPRFFQVKKVGQDGPTHKNKSAGESARAARFFQS